MPVPTGTHWRDITDYGDAVSPGYNVGSGGNDFKALQAARDDAVADPFYSAAQSVSGAAAMGLVYFPALSGTNRYNLQGTVSFSNFEMQVEAGACLQPSASTTHTMLTFNAGGSTVANAVKNVRVKGVGSQAGNHGKITTPKFGFNVDEMFVVDLNKNTNGGKSEDFCFARMNNAQYIEFDNIYYRQNDSTAAQGPASATACIVGGTTSLINDAWNGPDHAADFNHSRHCKFFNMYTVNSPYGYGMFQMDSFFDWEIRQVCNQGGKTVRFETDGRPSGHLDEAYLYDIFNYDGGMCVVLTPAGKWNGSVYADGVYADSSEYAVNMEENRNTSGLGKFEISYFINVYARPGNNAQYNTSGTEPWTFSKGNTSSMIVDNNGGGWANNMKFFDWNDSTKTVVPVHGAPVSGFDPPGSQTSISTATYDTDMSGFGSVGPVTPPSIPTPIWDTKPLAASTDRTPSFSYHVASGTWRFRYKLDGPSGAGAWTADDEATDGTTGFVNFPTALPLGAYTMSVRTHDPATGENGTEISWAFVINPVGSVVPGTPSITSGPAEASNDADTTPTFVWSASVSGTADTYEVQVDGHAPSTGPQVVPHYCLIGERSLPQGGMNNHNYANSLETPQGRPWALRNNYSNIKSGDSASKWPIDMDKNAAGRGEISYMQIHGAKTMPDGSIPDDAQWSDIAAATPGDGDLGTLIQAIGNRFMNPTAWGLSAGDPLPLFYFCFHHEPNNDSEGQGFGPRDAIKFAGYAANKPFSYAYQNAVLNWIALWEDIGLLPRADDPASNLLGFVGGAYTYNMFDPNVQGFGGHELWHELILDKIQFISFDSYHGGVDPFGGEQNITNSTTETCSKFMGQAVAYARQVGKRVFMGEIGYAPHPTIGSIDNPKSKPSFYNGTLATRGATNPSLRDYIKQEDIFEAVLFQSNTFPVQGYYDYDPNDQAACTTAFRALINDPYFTLMEPPATPAVPDWQDVGAPTTYTTPVITIGPHQFRVRGVNTDGTGAYAERNWSIVDPTGSQRGGIPGRTVGGFTIRTGSYMYATGPALTPDVPSGMQIGDVVFAIIQTRGSGAVFDAPDGWIQLNPIVQSAGNPNCSMAIYYRVLEPSGFVGNPPTDTGQYTFDVGLANGCSAHIIPVANVDVTTILDDFDPATSAGVVGNPVAPNSNVSELPAMVMTFVLNVGAGALTPDPLSLMTEHYETLQDATGNRHVSWMGVKAAAATGGTGPLAVTASTTSQWCAATVVVSERIAAKLGAAFGFDAGFTNNTLVTRTPVFRDHYLGTVRQVLGQGAFVMTDLDGIMADDGTFTFNQAAYDTMATEIATYGLRWIPSLRAVNTAGASVTPNLQNATNPNSANGTMLSWGTFCQNMYARYGQGGAFTAPGWQPVNIWQIWRDIDTELGTANPNAHGDLTAVDNYFELVARGVIGIEAAAGTNPVYIVGPGAIGVDPTKLAAVVDYWKSTGKTGLFSRLDAWSVRMDSTTAPKTAGATFQATTPYYSGTFGNVHNYMQLNWLRQLMNQEGGSARDIWITGGGYAGDDTINSYHDPGTLLTGQTVLWEGVDSDNIGTDLRLYTEGDQQAWTGGAIDLIFANPLWRVEGMSWSQLFDNGIALTAANAATYTSQRRGLVRYNEATDEPLPAGAIDFTEWKRTGQELALRSNVVPNTPPSCLITSPPDGSTILTPGPTITDATVDLFGDASDPDGTLATIQGGIGGQPLGNMTLRNNGGYRKILTLPGAAAPGNSVTLRMEATDDGGQMTFDEVTVNVVIPSVTVNPPNVVIQSPLDGATLTSAQGVVQALITSGSGFITPPVVEVGAVTPTVTELTPVIGQTDVYAATVDYDFTPGSTIDNTVTVRAVEGSGQNLEGTDTLIVHVAVSAPTAPPTLRAVSPVEGATLQGTSPRLVLEATGTSPIVLAKADVNGTGDQNMTFDGVFWTLQTTSLQEGGNTVTYTVTNASSLTSTQTVNFSVTVFDPGDVIIIVEPPPEPVVAPWRLVTYDVVSGSKIAEFDPRELRFGKYLRSTGYINCAVSYDGHPELERTLRPKAMDFCLFKGNTKIIAGNIDQVSWDKDERVVRMAGNDWLAYLEARILDFDPFSSAQQNFFQVDVDAFTVIERLFDFVFTQPSRQLNLAYNNGTAGYKTTCHVLAADLRTLLEIVQEVADQQPGFDFLVNPDKQFRMYSPRRQGHSGYICTDGVNIKSVHDGVFGPIGTEVYGTGAGTSTSKLLSYKRDASLELQIRRRTHIQDFGEVTNMGMLDGLTEAEWNRITADVHETWITLWPQQGDNFWQRVDVGLDVTLDTWFGPRHYIDDAIHVVGLEGYVAHDGQDEAVLTINDERLVR